MDPVVTDRRSTRVDELGARSLEKVGAVWHVRSAHLARALLRETGTTQAGFLAEAAHQPGVRPPILRAHGEDHRRQRSLTARYFAPRTVDSRYRPLMESCADQLIGRLVADGGGKLDDLTQRYAVEVASEVIGLTDSDIGSMARHLSRLLEHPAWDPAEEGGGRGRLARALAQLTALLPVAVFWWADVAPAVRRRRRAGREDVISHLVTQGCSSGEILIECITYAAAGMVTTREFITMATWHFLDAPDLRARYLVAEEPERMAILSEILRLEPVVGHLLRRVREPIALVHDGETVRFEPGELVDLYVRAANADPAAVGPNGLSLCPQRPLERGFRPEALRS